MTLIDRTSGETRILAVISKVATGAAQIVALYLVSAFLHISASRPETMYLSVEEDGGWLL